MNEIVPNFWKEVIDENTDAYHGTINGRRVTVVVHIFESKVDYSFYEGERLINVTTSREFLMKALENYTEATR